MGRYRKIDTRIWNDQKFRSLSDRGKLVFLFVLTHPHLTSLGAMRATLDGLATELGWPSKAFREAFAEAFRKALLECDEKASFVAAPNFLKYNGPESPNVVKSWADALDLIPECELKHLLLQRVKAFAEALPEAFAKALPEAFRKGMPNQEPEQEQEQEQELPPISPPRGTSYSSTFEEWFSRYPRKVGKEAASKAYTKAGKRLVARGMSRTESVAFLLDRCTAFSQSPISDGEFCPHPSTWLNQGRYDDDPAAWQDRAAKQDLRPVLDFGGSE